MNGGCNCRFGGCALSKTMKVLLFVGGLNWGLVGLGMLLGKGDAWNVVNVVLGSMPTLEAVVYLLVGVAAVSKICGCKCAKFKAACGSCTTCQTGDADQNM